MGAAFAAVAGGEAVVADEERAGLDLAGVNTDFIGDALRQRLESHRLEESDQRFVVRLPHAKVFNRHLKRHLVVKRDKLF